FMTMVTGDGYGGLEHRASTALMTARKDLPVLGHVFMTMVTGDGYGGLEHRASTALMTARKDLPVLG
ncbi:hypothetical protein CTI14_72525, partial [Methylobacterium radiotolerans]